MRVFLLGIITFFIWFSCLSTQGENLQAARFFDDDPSVFGRNNVSLSLFPLIQFGYEINYDRRIANRHWLKFAPIYYRIENYRESRNHDLRTLQGLGFKVQHKYYAYVHTRSEYGMYLSYGPGFQTFNIVTKGHETVKFDKYNFECVIGFRRVLREVFFFEFYGGLATTFLNNRSDEDVDWRDVLKNHNSLWFDYGIAGNHFVIGFKLGFLF